VAETLRSFGKSAKRRIYITLGHGGKVATEDFQKMLDGCANPDWAVFVSLGFRPPEQMPVLPANAIAGGFTGIAAPISWSDLVINHGGYATVMTGLMYGKPSIIMPYMSEQEANGILFVEKPGSGFVLRRTFTSREAGKKFEYHLRYSGRSKDGSFTAEEVRKGVEEIFSNPEFAARALDYSAKLRETVEGRSFEKLLGRIADLKPALGK
jgi:UDP:flavonoid glycosyltransferase YjiC (YdhE family)